MQDELNKLREEKFDSDLRKYEENRQNVESEDIELDDSQQENSKVWSIILTVLLIAVIVGLLILIVIIPAGWWFLIGLAAAFIWAIYTFLKMFF